MLYPFEVLRERCRDDGVWEFCIRTTDVIAYGEGDLKRPVMQFAQLDFFIEADSREAALGEVARRVVSN